MFKMQYVRSNVQGALCKVECVKCKAYDAMCKMQCVGCNISDTTCKMQCVNGSASQTSWTEQLDWPAWQTSWMDQLNRPNERTSWTDQLFLFEALANSHIRRFFFKFVHCRSFRVRRRPCFLNTLCIFSILYFFRKHKILSCKKLHPNLWKPSRRKHKISYG